MDGTQIKSGASIAVQGMGVALLARKDLSKSTTTAGSTTTSPTTENLVQARLLAEGDIALLASGTGTDQGKLFITGAKIEANNGHPEFDTKRCKPLICIGRASRPATTTGSFERGGRVS